MAEFPNRPVETRRPGCIKGGWPAWTRLFAVRAACLAGLYLLFEHGPRALRWPLRFLMAAGAVWAAVAFVRESLEWTERAAAWWVRHRSVAKGDLPLRSGSLERGLAWTVVLLAALHVGLMMSAMSSASLREDEIGTIDRYSSRGPVETVTKYDLAKNHILFNLVNSLTPGADSFHPLRARFWSFAAVAAAIAMGVGWFFRRDAHAEGAMVAALLGLNAAQLGVSLEARGYGFLLLAALTASLALPTLLASGGAGGRSLAVVAASAVLGSYTVPSYLVFGGTLLVLVWLLAPSQRTFLAGWFAAVAILVLYLPVLGGLWRVVGEYDDRYADLFGDLKRLVYALRFLVPHEWFVLGDWGVASVVSLLLTVPVVAGIQHRPRTRAALVVLSLTAGFYAFCLKLQTPPDRVTAFLAAPVAVAFAFLFAELRGRFPQLHAGAGVALCVGLCAGGIASIRGFEYAPSQRWRDVARFISAFAPAATRVWIAGPYARANEVYLGRTYPVRTGEIDREAYALGEWILHDDRFRNGDRPLIDRDFKPAERAVIRFPVRGSETRLFVTRPSGAAPEVRPGEGGEVLSLRVPAGMSGILLQADRDWSSLRRLSVESVDPQTGLKRRLALQVEGRFLAFRVPPQGVPSSIVLRAHKAPTGEWQEAKVTAWAFPPSSIAGREAGKP